MSALLPSNNIQNIKKNVGADFEKSPKKSDFGPIWAHFPKFWENENFFEKSDSVTFLHLRLPNYMCNIREIVGAVPSNLWSD